MGVASAEQLSEAPFQHAQCVQAQPVQWFITVIVQAAGLGVDSVPPVSPASSPGRWPESVTAGKCLHSLACAHDCLQVEMKLSLWRNQYFSPVQAVCGLQRCSSEVSNQSCPGYRKRILLCIMLCWFNIGAEGAFFFPFLGIAAPSLGFSAFCPWRQPPALLVSYRELEHWCVQFFPLADILAAKDVRCGTTWDSLYWWLLLPFC